LILVQDIVSVMRTHLELLHFLERWLDWLGMYSR